MILFAYNFPHKKTQDFIFWCLANDISIDVIVAADPVKLNIPKSSIRSKIRHNALLHPKELAARFGIRYEVAAHNSEACEQLLKEMRPKIGLISGARILKRNIIDQFSIGIINFHPGLIPEARGLDAMFWSIEQGIPLGVTSHIIDHRVDAGKILEKKIIDVHDDDSLIDLSERLYEAQLEMILSSYKLAVSEKYMDTNFENSNYNKKMPTDLEETLTEKLSEYKRKLK